MSTTTTDQTITPKFPEPVDAPVPAWATQAGEWQWVIVDDVWQRTVSRPFRWAEAGGFDVDSFQEASADGTVTTDPSGVWFDLAEDMIDNAADARQLGQWLIEAAEVMEAIEAAQVA